MSLKSSSLKGEHYSTYVIRVLQETTGKHKVPGTATGWQEHGAHSPHPMLFSEHHGDALAFTL